VTRAELAANDLEMTIPRLVTTGEIHAVHDQWKTYVPTPQPAVKVGELIPIMPVQRRSGSVPARQ